MDLFFLYFYEAVIHKQLHQAFRVKMVDVGVFPDSSAHLGPEKPDEFEQRRFVWDIDDKRAVIL